MIFNSSKGCTFLECFKLPVPLAWEVVNKHKCSRKSPDKPVRQVRKLSEGFELKPSNYMPRSLIK